LSEVMVRNRRSTVGLQFTRRWARTERLALAAEEQQLYDGVARFVRQHLGTASGQGALSRMGLITLQMALGSSLAAAAGTLQRLSEHAGLSEEDRRTLEDLAGRARQPAESAKVNRLLQLLEEFPDKMVIFTQFRATQDLLAERLRQAGH